MENVSIIFSLIFSLIALIISLFILWKDYLAPFKLKVTNSNPHISLYKITPDISGTPEQFWWIPSIDIGISFYNLGKRNGEILDIRIIAEHTPSDSKKIFKFHPKWNVDYSKFHEYQHQRFTWIKKAVFKEWYSLLLRGYDHIHLHIILESNRFEEMILGKIVLSLQIKTSKNMNWKTIGNYEVRLFEDLYTKKDTITAMKIENLT